MKIQPLLPLFGLWFIFQSSCHRTNENKPYIYTSPEFTLYPDSVVWGEHTAEIKSDSFITSTYHGADEIPFDNTIKLYSWNINYDISHYPAFTSDIPLLNALYLLSLEELEKNKTPDGLFYNTGAKWEGVWTRDVSYSFLLSSAYLSPEIAKRSLMKKVKNGVIIQDTGSGGSWPISTDRLTWVLAAWEIYNVTGDDAWLTTVYPIIKQSLIDDQLTAFYPNSLALGESSFLDWREQSYPLWMKPIDIYRSENLGTNIVHYQSYHILANMAKLLNEPADKWQTIAEELKTNINERLWIKSQGYYGQYLYGKHYLSPSPRFEALGEALAILTGVANKKQAVSIMQNAPLAPYGIPTFSPQIPGIPPYHNNSMWPFVQSFWNWAAAKTEHKAALEHGLASLYRAAAIYLTNKENLVLDTGEAHGTQINSDRQLWSVAGNLAMIYRIFAGMRFETDGLYLNPVILPEYGRHFTINKFKYRNATLNIDIIGHGTRIKTVKINGKTAKNAFIPTSAEGKISIKIEMADNPFPKSKIKPTAVTYSPDYPKLSQTGSVIVWEKISDAKQYNIYQNGKLEDSTTATSWTFPTDILSSYTELQVSAVNYSNIESFLSEPLIFGNEILIETENDQTRSKLPYSGFTGSGFVELDKNMREYKDFSLTADIKESGSYLLVFRYSNGSGPMCCTNSTGLRTLFVNGQEYGTMVFPILTENNWSDWGFSNYRKIKLNAGKNQIELKFLSHNENMNREINRFMLDHIKLITLDR